jgi:hypothetical protein
MARVAIAPKNNTLASQSRLRTSNLSSSIDRSGFTILPTNARTVISNPRTQKARETMRQNLAMQVRTSFDQPRLISRRDDDDNNLAPTHQTTEYVATNRVLNEPGSFFH